MLRITLVAVLRRKGKGIQQGERMMRKEMMEAAEVEVVRSGLFQI